jgi:hypothetical protein
MNKTVLRPVATNKQIKADLDRILRNLSEKEKFYFYKGLGQPIDEKASSLTDFAKKIEKIDALSLAFHYYRGDFGRWINYTIGDSVLGYRLNGKEETVLYGEPLRGFLTEHVQKRFNELKINSR